MCSSLLPDSPEQPRSDNGVSGRRGSLRPLLLCGTALIVLCSIYGLMGNSRDWPVASYPAFAYRANDKIRALYITVHKSHGRSETWRLDSDRRLRRLRIGRMIERAIRQESKIKRARLKDICRLALATNPALRDAHMLELQEVLISVTPSCPQGQVVARGHSALFLADELR